MAKKSSTSTASAPSSTQVALVEGSVTPAVGVLKRGKRAEVPYTKNVEDLIRRGFIDLVGFTDGSVPDPNPLQPPTTLPGTGVDPGNQDLVEASPIQTPDQSLPEVPDLSLVNQDLVEATPPSEDKPNPDVDNSLVDITEK